MAEKKTENKEVVETTEKHEEDGVVVETTTRVKTDGKGAGKTGQKKGTNKKSTNKKGTKKTKKPIVWWPWIIAGGMVTSAIILCLCGRCRDRNSGCRDCERPVKDTTEIVQKPCDTCANVYVSGDYINIEGDGLVIKDSQDVAASMGDITGDGNNVANRGCVNTKPKKSTPVTKKEVIVYDTVKVERPRNDVKPNEPIKLTLEATQYEIMVCRSY